MYGVVKGLINGQNARVDELNQRIYDRFVPNANLEPNYDPRPVPTKYALFPMVDRRIPTNVDIPHMSNFDVGQSGFAPFESSGPVSGYLGNVDIESKLRRQVHVLTKYGREDEYIPSSDSDLFKVQVAKGSDQSPQPFAGLFQKPLFSTDSGFADGRIGQDRFFNHTRTQLRAL